MAELSNPPSTLALMGKAAFKGTDSTQLADMSTCRLPENRLSLVNQMLRQSDIDAFNRQCEWQQKASAPIHPCYLHTLAFPLHLALMLQSDFPFKLLGLVHLENHITQFRPVHANERIDIHCYFGQLTAHEKGWTFSIVTEVNVGQETVWKSRSINLFRAQHEDTSPRKEQPSRELLKHPEAQWSFKASAGRQYASVSGDYNLIHLYPLSAKLFGFRRHIAHGMYSKSRCLSAMLADKPDNFSVSVQFVKPVFLPGQVTLHTQSTDAATCFELQSPQGDILHLKGSLSFSPQG